MGWIKAVGNWIFGQLGNFPTAAAQKEKYETKIMLLEAEHKKAIDVLEAENRDLPCENRTIDPGEQTTSCVGFPSTTAIAGA
jgi:hypothetical protein